jgi:hypothetical protein
VRVVFIVFLLVLDVAPRAGHGARRRASRASLVENEARRDLNRGHSVGRLSKKCDDGVGDGVAFSRSSRDVSHDNNAPRGGRRPSSDTSILRCSFRDDVLSTSSSPGRRAPR